MRLSELRTPRSRMALDGREGEDLRRHVLGVTGEQSVLLWLRATMGDQIEVLDVADQSDTPSDLRVVTSKGAIGIEVKTTTYDGWKRFGRSVPEEQLWATDAQAYVWCVGPASSKPEQIHIVGWSATTDVRQQHTAQRYTGARGGMRGQPNLPSVPTVRNDGPQYDVDDVGFDEVEWHQTPGMREPEERGEWLLLHEPASAPASVSWLVDHAWQEGREPRPGFGSGTPTVAVSAPVRPLAELIQWIDHWTPDSLV